MKMFNGSRKKLFAASAVALVTVVGGGVALASHNFSDVPNGAWYHDSVDFLQSRDITGGCEGGVGNKFCPDRNVTRAEMSAFLSKNAQALSPVIGASAKVDLTEGVNDCIVGPFTPGYKMTAVISGGIYAVGPGVVASEPQYSANGGPWTDTEYNWSLPSQPATNAWGNAPLSGIHDLEPGVSYRFSSDVGFLGDGTGIDTGCELTVVIHHRMPGTGGAAALEGLPVDQDFDR